MMRHDATEMGADTGSSDLQLLRLDLVVVGPDWLLALIGISLRTQPMEFIHVGSQNLPVYPC